MKVSEYVSLGHPDKIADYISSYLYDRCRLLNPAIKYGVEVMVKDNTIVFGGEVNADISSIDLKEVSKEALREIGYDELYCSFWKDECIDINSLKVIDLIGQQSNQIAQGLVEGWGDQGVFYGYASLETEEYLPKEFVLAHNICNRLYDFALNSPKKYGIDIKVLVTWDEVKDEIYQVIAAVPTKVGTEELKDLIVCEYNPKHIVINGTGDYTKHSSVADCGITGRKLAIDFYGGRYGLGGGSPWTKDWSKADLTLNLTARLEAVRAAKDYKTDCRCCITCQIGKGDPRVVITDYKGRLLEEYNLKTKPKNIIKMFNGIKVADLCKKGLLFYE